MREDIRIIANHRMLQRVLFQRDCLSDRFEKLNSLTRVSGSTRAAMTVLVVRYLPEFCYTHPVVVCLSLQLMDTEW